MTNVITRHGVELCISRDKEEVRRWAKATKRPILWLDSQGYWHAAKRSRLLAWLPRFCVKQEYA